MLIVCSSPGGSFGRGVIDDIYAFLDEIRLVPSGARVPFNISFLRATLVELFVDEKHSIVVKVAPAKSDAAAAILREHDALRMQEGSFTHLVPVPLALTCRGGTVLLVLQGIVHRPATLEDLCSAHISGQSDMCKFLCRAETTMPMARGSEARALPLERAFAYLPDLLRQKIITLGGTREWPSLQASLPPVAQHCDLSINNVGRTAEGFVVFDWEDYGRIALPGFDICTLIASACAFDPGRVHAMVTPGLAGGPSARGVLGQAMHRLPTPPGCMVDLFLMSLVLFHALKCELGYGGVVIENSRKLISALIESSSQEP